jgi:hypothetical protein
MRKTGLGVANGDTWRVEAVDGDQITMRQVIDADRETGERRYADRTVVYGSGQTSADLASAAASPAAPEAVTPPGIRLATRISEDVDRRLRLAALVRRMPLSQLLDQALPPVAELAERMKGTITDEC